MVVQPTGSGKSVCYQLPALLLPGLVLVISPLTAHVRDAISKVPANIPAGVCLGGEFKRASMVRPVAISAVQQVCMSKHAYQSLATCNVIHGRAMPAHQIYALCCKVARVSSTHIAADMNAATGVPLHTLWSAAHWMDLYRPRLLRQLLAA